MKPITTDLAILSQSINIDIESIAPKQGYAEGCYDVANSTITAEVNVPTAGEYRLVLAMETEEYTSASVRVVSGTDKHFKQPAKFKSITRGESEILLPVLQKAGIPLEAEQAAQLDRERSHYKVADITLPAGTHVLRIQASQKLLPVAGNPKQYQFVVYAPQLSLAPAPNVKLGVTVVFPMDFTATIAEPVVEPLPGQPMPAQDAFNRPTVGVQQAFGWAFHADPKITIGYTYN